MAEEESKISTICDELSAFLARDVLADNVQFNEVTILKEIGVDSFSLMEIILFIERKYGIILPEQELTPENLESIKKISLCLQKHL